MKIQPYVQKLESSNIYKDFQGKFKDAYLTAGFFVIDFETGKNIHQIDYYVPSQKKVAAFTLDKTVEIAMLDLLEDKTPEKMNMNTFIDLDELKGIIEDEMKNRSMVEKIRKMIAVVQTIKGKKMWNVNCFLTEMEILKAHVDDTSKTILSLEKMSVYNLMKKLSPDAQVPGQVEKPSPAMIDKQIKQLDKLKDALRKEKEKLTSGPAPSEEPKMKSNQMRTSSSKKILRR